MDVTIKDEKQRIYYIDNVKAILIALVVVGHFLNALAGLDKTWQGWQLISNFIYIFHMPAFVLLSGYLAKLSRHNSTRCLGLLILYTITQIIFYLLNKYILCKDISFSYFNTNGAMWYLQSLLTWLLLIPIVKLVKPCFLIVLSLIVGIIAGYDSSIGNYASFSRTLVFFPLFIIGFFAPKTFGKSIPSKRIRYFSFAVLVCVLWIVFAKKELVLRQILTADVPYSKINKWTTLLSGVLSNIKINEIIVWGLYRSIWYLISFGTTICFLCLVPHRKLPISYIGKYTMPIFVLHAFIWTLMVHYGIVNYFVTQYSSISVLLFSICLVFILGNRYVAKPFDFIMNGSFIKTRKD